MIAFNLAGYASVTARFEDARTRLRHAIELDKDIRELALEDEDLRPLWDWIATLGILEMATIIRIMSAKSCLNEKGF